MSPGADTEQDDVWRCGRCEEPMELGYPLEAAAVDSVCEDCLKVTDEVVDL